MQKLNIFFFCATVFSLIAGSMIGGGSVRAAQPAPTHLRFSAYWSGLHAADLALSYWVIPPSKNDPHRRRHSLRIQTQSLVRFVTNLRLDAISEGTQTMVPARENSTANNADLYRVNYATRRRTRTVEVTYDHRLATPKIRTKNAPLEKDRRNEAKVPLQHRRGTIDPLLAIISTLDRVRDHVNFAGPNTFVLPIYDGRRRFDVTGRYLGIVKRGLLNQTAQVHKLRLVPRPIAGFKDSHLAVWDTYEFDLYISTDGRFLPLQIDAVGPGPIIHLVEQCATPCPLSPSD